MRISDWSSDVCSSDLERARAELITRIHFVSPSIDSVLTNAVEHRNMIVNQCVWQIGHTTLPYIVSTQQLAPEAGHRAGKRLRDELRGDFGADVAQIDRRSDVQGKMVSDSVDLG